MYAKKTITSTVAQSDAISQRLIAFYVFRAAVTKSNYRFSGDRISPQTAFVSEQQSRYFLQEIANSFAVEPQACDYLNDGRFNSI